MGVTEVGAERDDMAAMQRYRDVFGEVPEGLSNV